MSNNIQRIPGTGANIFIDTNGQPNATDGYNYPSAVHTPDSCQFSSTLKHKPKSFLGKVKDFAKGFGGAFMGLFSLKGMMVAAACTVAATLCPALVPLMIVGTVAISGFGMLKALKNGDYKAAGENAFGLAGGIFGARGFAKGGLGESASGSVIKNTLGNLRKGEWGELARLWGGELKTGLKNGTEGLRNIGQSLTKGEYWNTTLKKDIAAVPDNWRSFKGNKFQSAWKTFKGVFLGADNTPVTAIQTLVSAGHTSSTTNI